MPISTFPYHRIAIVGTTGSGKSTLAGNLAHHLHIPHIELDALHWEPNWTEAPHEVLRLRVEAATCCPAWVTDGNYHVVRDILWSRAEAIIWLDYPLVLIFWRLWWRTWKRVLTKELLWGNNHERLAAQFFSRDSLFLWAMQTYWRRKKEYPVLLARPEYAHLKVFHFHSPREANTWLDSLNINAK